MTLICKHCQAELPDGMRYCGYCGARLSDPPLYLDTHQRSQIRHVTVLFADLEGYTVAANRLDSEALYELVQQYTDLLSREVYKYEGIIDKMTGDGIMALFGAPVSYENNTERAIRAALDMQANFLMWRQHVQQNLNLDLNLRIGLHCGPVIVGEIGSNIVMDYTAIGETVNLAYRLQEIADPGSIFTSAEVVHQTRAIFDYEQLPDATLKGFDHPVPCYRLIGIKPLTGSTRTGEGLHAPLIGRQLELNHLLQAAHQIQSSAQGKFILICGEVGIGKSRLLQEFKNRLTEENIPYLEGYSLTYRRSVPYWIFTDLLRHQLGISAKSTIAEIRRQLSQTLQSCAADQATSLVPYLEHLFSLPTSDPNYLLLIQNLEADQFRQQVLTAIRSILYPCHADQPRIWILEDLQWADEVSLSILQTVIADLDQTPLLIVAAARSENFPPLQKFFQSLPSIPSEMVERIELHSLTDEESHTLLAKLVDIQQFPAKLTQNILEHAAGIPLYLEEILRMLMDAGALVHSPSGLRPHRSIDGESLGVPITLQGLIQARFDQLTAFQRTVLQYASIIGHHFSRGLLEAILPVHEEDLQKTLQELIEREFIVATPDHPQGEFAFRHLLISEAVYNTLLKKERSRLHTLVGTAIESHYSGRLNEVIELLARHFSWGNQPEKALHYLILAAQKAMTGSLYEQAQKHYEHALTLLPGVESAHQQALQVHLGLGDLYQIRGEVKAARAQYLAALDRLSQMASPEVQEIRNNLLRKLRELTASAPALQERV
jgi:class 3 adenylate cyclase/tetratricopeptide (TPR) repeat protein